MTKTKRQLRAEAVERLKQLDGHYDGEDIVKAMVPEGVIANITNWAVELDTIIDLLVDDEIPDGDAVDIMRKAANGGFEGSIGSVVKNAKKLLGMDPYNGEDLDMMRKLADMVERDYVRRIDFEVKDAEVADLRAERDRMQADYERIYQFQEVETERNHWKSNAERYKAERDRWKARAESSSKVRAGSSNLEWLFEHDRDFSGTVIAAAQIRRLYPDDCETPQHVGEWLMAPHEDEGDESCRQDADQWERAESADCESDTREKLEADMRQYMLAACAQGWEAGQHDDMDCCNFYISDMRALLDRQAAITERHILTHPDERDEQIAELEGKVDELTAERDAWKARAEGLEEAYGSL